MRVELARSAARAKTTAYGAKLKLGSSGRELACSRLRSTDATGRELAARVKVLSPDRLPVRLADAHATFEAVTAPP